MTKAKLEILNLEVPIGLLKEYHDDGFVESIRKHSEMLLKKYKCRGKLDEKFDGDLVGICNGFKFFLKKYFHIYYLDTNFAPLNIQIRAHEETHALDCLGHLEILSEKMLEEQKIKIDFKKLKDKEIRAQIGSIYALFSHGLHPSMMDNFFYNSDFEIAKRIYKQSRFSNTIY